MRRGCEPRSSESSVIVPVFGSSRPRRSPAISQNQTLPARSSVRPYGRPRALYSAKAPVRVSSRPIRLRSEEHTSELQSLAYLVCRLLLEKKKKLKSQITTSQDVEMRWALSD